MRTLLTTLALAAGMAVLAQDADMDDDKKTPDERATQRTEIMTKELSLTADQQAKVLDVNKRFATNMVAVKKIEDKDSKRMRAKSLKDNRDKMLQTILTPDQYTRMISLRDKKKEEHKDKKAGTHQE